MASASARDSTCGTITPIAPTSSDRVRYWGSCAGTRTSGVIPAPIAAEHSNEVVSSDVAVCSRSTYTASNPAAAAIVGMSAVRAWVSAMHNTSCPASSRSRIEGTPGIMLRHRPSVIPRPTRSRRRRHLDARAGRT